ncbi:MAG: hypothetical protein CL802_13445 [Citromicrobium sp.]|nr:hypothetical protein [Citromicrobium sp.]|tara:strand:- start:1778 stop:2536 length:759 start_codon:yes stop_codon:yes gene_type:complete
MAMNDKTASPLKESMVAWLDAIRPLIELVANRPWASVLTVTLLGPIATLFVFVMNPDPFLSGGARLLDLFGQNHEAARLERENDKAIYALMTRVMGEARAGRAVVKIFLFDPDAYQRTVALIETHEVLDRAGERSGIRHAQLRQEDVQATLDFMFPGMGYAPRCITLPVGSFPDPALNDFLSRGKFTLSSACPIRALDGTMLGLFSLSTRQAEPLPQELETHTRDAANIISGYLSRSAAVDEALASRQGDDG